MTFQEMVRKFIGNQIEVAVNPSYYEGTLKEVTETVIVIEESTVYGQSTEVILNDAQIDYVRVLA
ncbi:hypothetical protein FY534_04250 [Alicyclobacillus sp. TC]|uniref:DUF2642 domain-containing protein n=2 Tax=Alicyclobacillus tolerans TaxID=90970 RepID=A0ABT9LSH4_9BACL|nr:MULTISPECIES: hypothetical protein [Alicyclobacillus]MDP9727216.1 hypothetical protein [Alicyclobacillus tengchongensis]QRF22977.1 hypothetical protein FY534_04250 [Alicyclobacillus sp. TC]SHJ58139.1 hypothetical protein SAMN05443507_101244 [Alicyclobacillus montanus]